MGGAREGRRHRGRHSSLEKGVASEEEGFIWARGRVNFGKREG